MVASSRANACCCCSGFVDDAISLNGSAASEAIAIPVYI